MNKIKQIILGRTKISSVVRIGLLLTLILMPVHYHYQLVYISGISMEPTYDNRQWALMQRSRSLGDEWVPDRFDVILVWSDEYKELFCKRVIGLPGEAIHVSRGSILIDDRQLFDSFSDGKMVRRMLEDPSTGEPWWIEYENVSVQTIKPDEVWVVGDNREDSIFGHFPISKIRGKVVLY